MTDLKVCQDCNVAPSVYGDGLTWSRCSSCQYKFENLHPNEQQQTSVEGGSIEHQTIEGLVSIVMPVYIVNYSLFHYTGNAIGSIREHTDKSDYELIVVDDGSPLKPPQKQSFYADKIIENEKNEGVTKSWNKGIRASFGEYICLINNDVQVFPGWLDDMKEALKHVDLVMSYPMYSLTEPFARAVESKKIRDLWLEKPIEDSLSDFRDWSCVMFKKSLIDELGLFDEDFKSYSSDLEFMDRIIAKGGKVASCKRVAIHHISDATGYSVPETPEIMNKDKETYENKKNSAKSEAMTSPDALGMASKTKDDANVLPNVKNLVRSSLTGDRIYFLVDNKAHWITSPEVLKGLGFDFGLERTLEPEEFGKFLKGEPINMDNLEKFKNAQI